MSGLQTFGPSHEAKRATTRRCGHTLGPGTVTLHLSRHNPRLCSNQDTIVLSSYIREHRWTIVDIMKIFVQYFAMIELLHFVRNPFVKGTDGKMEISRRFTLWFSRAEKVVSWQLFVTPRRSADHLLENRKDGPQRGARYSTCIRVHVNRYHMGNPDERCQMQCSYDRCWFCPLSRCLRTLNRWSHDMRVDNPIDPTRYTSMALIWSLARCCSQIIIHLPSTCLWGKLPRPSSWAMYLSFPYTTTPAN